MAKISEMARTTLRERQLEGIQIAEIKGKYKGLEKDYPNPRRDFKALRDCDNYLRRNNQTYNEIAKFCDCIRNIVVNGKEGAGGGSMINSLFTSIHTVR